MNKGVKIALGVVAGLVLAGIVIAVVKSKKKDTDTTGDTNKQDASKVSDVKTSDAKPFLSGLAGGLVPELKAPTR